MSLQSAFPSQYALPDPAANFNPQSHTASWAQQSAAVAVAGYAAAGAYSAAGYHHPGTSSAASDPGSGAGPTATTASSSQFPGYSHHQTGPPSAPPGVMPGQHCASHHQASAWTRHHVAQSAAKAVDVPTAWTDNYSLFASGASHYSATNLTPHSPSEAKSGYPYFGQLSGMEAGMVCGRVH
ncbi:hypothetical protein L798_10930 [Zootermopsis nevadensis]|uniref:Uncharacterized protein n=2 Tax=Zootermopsis nevadensis TaxID=136037 RepID=A0A067RGU4_ZOONE|nr:hypothetical protein L798_10930 [Zootermopsis nevadensis]